MGIETMMIIGTVVSVAGQVMGGLAQAKQANYQRAQMEVDKRQAALSALQDENDRRKQLRMVLAQQTAAAGGMGVSVDGRSLLAIQREEKATAKQDVLNIRTMGSTTQQRLTLGAKAAKESGRMAIVSGVMGGASTGISGYKKISDYNATKTG